MEGDRPAVTIGVGRIDMRQSETASGPLHLEYSHLASNGQEQLEKAREVAFGRRKITFVVGSRRTQNV